MMSVEGPRFFSRGVYRTASEEEKEKEKERKKYSRHVTVQTVDTTTFLYSTSIRESDRTP